MLGNNFNDGLAEKVEDLSTIFNEIYPNNKSKIIKRDNIINEG